MPTNPAQSPPFDSQFAEIEDVERSNRTRAQSATSDSSSYPSPLTDLSTLAPENSYLPSSASTTPSQRSPSPDMLPLITLSGVINPALRQHIRRLNRNTANLFNHRAPAPRLPNSRRQHRRYSIPRLLSQRVMPNGLPPIDPANTTTAILPRRRTYSTAFGLSRLTTSSYGVPLPPVTKRRLCTVFAIEVQVGDILKYGNEINDGCKVTQVGLEEREEQQQDQPLQIESGIDNGDDDDDDKEEDKEDGKGEYEERIQAAVPVDLNGTVRIQWETEAEAGEWLWRRSQLFEGLEMLQVLRVVGKKKNLKEDEEEM